MSEGESASTWEGVDVLPAGDREDLVLLSNNSMRARRRPLAIVLLWGWQTAFTALVAWPAAAIVASYYGRHPFDDAPLWERGGLPITDLGFELRAMVMPVVTLATLVFFLTALTELVPIGALFSSIGYVTRSRRAPSLRACMSRAVSSLDVLVSLFAVASLVEAALVGLAFLAGYGVSDAATNRLGEARADQLGLLTGLGVAFLAAIVGVVHDLARAGAMRYRVGHLRAWRFALNAFLRGPVAVIWSWAWRGIAGWAPVAVGGLVAARVGGRAGGALVALAVVHQLVLGARVSLRASWFAAAMRAVDQAHKRVRLGD
ncbi:MAG TPA: hypothetical protein VGI39_16185 [Polyangiaceae bacterium]